MSGRRLLISYAHPDDESFGLGGLIAKYVAEGVDVYLICATNGDVGTVSPELLNGYETIAELRLSELRCASELLGFKQVFEFGYRDSGMMNCDDNNHESCLWKAPLEDVTRRVVDVIREVQPQVVITFNKYGGYGHPDHIAIQRATTEAFTLAGDASYVTSQRPYKPQKLYYSGISINMVRLWVGLTHFRGQDPRRLGNNKDINIQAILDNVEPIHARVSIKGYYDKWQQANACHQSQGGGGGGMMRNIPKFLRPTLASNQGFTRVFPTPTQNRIDEYDLFAGVSAAEISTAPERELMR